jgi:chromosome segregation ATPase
VKHEEDFLLKQELRDNQAVLKQLEVWSVKEHGLRKKIAEIESADTGPRVESLRGEASKLDNEIRDMEIRLAQMKTRHRRILHEISEIENNVSSRLSSYKTSLSMLERDIQEFLKSPPTRGDTSANTAPFLALPPKRRTLELAKEHWQSETEDLKKQRRSAKTNRVALEDGADVWRDVVAEITEYEKYLRDAIPRLAQDGAMSPSGKGKMPADTESDPASAMLEKLNAVSQSVEEKLDLAHENDWRLLEICVAAELEALHQGRELLEKVLGIERNGTDAQQSDDPQDDESENEDPSTQDSSARDLFASAAEGLPKSSVPMSHSAALRKSMYEDDDGPDPELLFTRSSDDTD